MKRIFKIGFLFIAVILFFGISVIAEEITLTTYYPAPFGNYEELQAEKLAIGSTTTMPTADGSLAALIVAVGSGAIMPTEDGDIVADGTIRANIGFKVNDEPGHTGDDAYTIVTDVKMVDLTVQKRTRTITISGGIITAVSGESGWF